MMACQIYAANGTLVNIISLHSESLNSDKNNCMNLSNVPCPIVLVIWLDFSKLTPKVNDLVVVAIGTYSPIWNFSKHVIIFSDVIPFLDNSSEATEVL